MRFEEGSRDGSSVVEVTASGRNLPDPGERGTSLPEASRSKVIVGLLSSKPMIWGRAAACAVGKRNSRERAAENFMAARSNYELQGYQMPKKRTLQEIERHVLNKRQR